MGFLDELKRLTHPYEDEMDDDEYEEEELPADKIQTAIEMAETYASKSPIEIKASTEKLLVALKRAKELGKPLELFF